MATPRKKKKKWKVQIEFTDVSADKRIEALKLIADQAKKMTPPKGSTMMIYVVEG